MVDEGEGEGVCGNFLDGRFGDLDALGRRPDPGRHLLALAVRVLEHRDRPLELVLEHTFQGVEVPLTAMEFDLLRAFADHPNQVLSRDQLLTMTRNREWEPFDRSIDIRIARLRRKIEPDPARPSVIRTVRGAGYLFAPD